MLSLNKAYRYLLWTGLFAAVSAVIIPMFTMNRVIRECSDWDEDKIKSVVFASMHYPIWNRNPVIDGQRVTTSELEMVPATATYSYNAGWSVAFKVVRSGKQIAVLGAMPACDEHVEYSISR
ncbi:hypothetical protein [Rhizobium sp. PP-F2F-G48]|uniref:hypothetical protein n=1 Tax=Rhizobium sp. PP-F2F-G48 TaxID=2135651 RepID=UPI00104EACC5|nr:hypothetical protein [Rhizobium sp. PP-F2F-G48]